MAVLTMKLTNVAVNMVRDGLKGDVSDLEIKYIAIGDDNGAISPLAATNTTLGNETSRKLVTSKTGGGTGIMDTISILLNTEANGNIEELGFFAGTAAGAGADSGILVARGFYSKVKTNLLSVQFQSTDTIREG